MILLRASHCSSHRSAVRRRNLSPNLKFMDGPPFAMKRYVAVRFFLFELYMANYMSASVFFFVDGKLFFWYSYEFLMLLSVNFVSFRFGSQVVWENVRILKGSGETVSVDGTHLGHNIPDRKGNRYCINLVSVAGKPETKV